MHSVTEHCPIQCPNNIYTLNIFINLSYSNIAIHMTAILYLLTIYLVNNSIKAAVYKTEEKNNTRKYH